MAISFIIPTVILLIIFSQMRAFFGYRFNLGTNLVMMRYALPDVFVLMIVGTIPDYVQAVSSWGGRCAKVIGRAWRERTYPLDQARTPPAAGEFLFALRDDVSMDRNDPIDLSRNLSQNGVGLAGRRDARRNTRKESAS